MSLTREAILGANDLAPQEVKVDEWGGSVFVRKMSAADVDAWMQGHKPEMSNSEAMIGVIVACTVDADGNHLFTAEDVEALKAKSSKAVTRVYRAAARLNGLHKAAIADAEKNSQGGPGAAS